MIMQNIYDFDNTIFRGDSTFRFCRYIMRRHPTLLLRLPGIGLAFLRMALGHRTKTWAKQQMYRALLTPIDAGALLEDYWARNLHRVKQWYLDGQQESDIVISASPEFLLRPACERLGIRHLIASKVDIESGDCHGLNCHGEEKVRRYRLECEQVPFHFYSDSLSDSPMARLAEKAFWVKGDSISDWPER